MTNAQLASLFWLVIIAVLDIVVLLRVRSFRHTESHAIQVVPLPSKVQRMQAYFDQLRAENAANLSAAADLERHRKKRT